MAQYTHSKYLQLSFIDYFVWVKGETHGSYNSEQNEENKQLKKHDPPHSAACGIHPYFLLQSSKILKIFWFIPKNWNDRSFNSRCWDKIQIERVKVCFLHGGSQSTCKMKGISLEFMVP